MCLHRTHLGELMIGANEIYNWILCAVLMERILVLHYNRPAKRNWIVSTQLYTLFSNAVLSKEGKRHLANHSVRIVN